MNKSHKLEGRLRRKKRIRKSVVGSSERPRLSVFRSARHIYAQVIDDQTGITLASASTMSKDLRGGLADDGKKDAGKKTDAAKKVGALVAQQCKSKSISKVVFDRNGYLYHGRIKALADAAREAGLDF
jgi:large subunit ribosomal protein L18